MIKKKQKVYNKLILYENIEKLKKKYPSFFYNFLKEKIIDIARNLKINLSNYNV